jgi:hypothetical protein
MREITVVVVQMQPKLYEVGDNLIRMTDFVEKSSLHGPGRESTWPQCQPDGPTGSCIRHPHCLWHGTQGKSREHHL